MNKITSKDNQKIKDLIRLRDDSKFRNDKSLFYVEGERIIKDTPKEIIDSIFICETYIDKFGYIIERHNENEIYVVSENVYDKIKDTVSSQGIIAIVKSNIKNKINGDFILALDNIQDPGNLGTIIRLSEACGIDSIIINDGCCDIYNTKVIRSSMSSIFRLNIIKTNDLINYLINLKRQGYKIYSTALNNNTVDYKETDYSGKIVIVIGNEANGVNQKIIDLSDISLKIPMKGQIESLNASIATAIIAYEASRNR